MAGLFYVYNLPADHAIDSGLAGQNLQGSAIREQFSSSMSKARQAVSKA